MLYGVERWPINNSYVQKIKVAKMRMLRWMYGHTRRDKIRNEGRSAFDKGQNVGNKA